jgi:hypothetical protein
MRALLFDVATGCVNIEGGCLHIGVPTSCTLSAVSDFPDLFRTLRTCVAKLSREAALTGLDHKCARASAVHLCPVRRVSCVDRMDYTSGGPVGGRPNHAKFSVPPDMVALKKIQEPWYNQRLATNDMRLTIYGGSQPTTKVAPARAIKLAPPAQRWKPRSGRGFAVWRADLADRLSTHDLLDTSCTGPPTLGDAEKTWAGCSADEIFALYKDACAEYKAENTAVFHVVMSTIDLSGIREETDIAFITRHFHEGGERDGNGLLKWCEEFADHTDTGEQDRLQILLAETKLSGHGVTVVMLEKHAVELLSTWSKIAGNDIAAPASYYSRLLSSIPPGINGAVGTLRSWLADKITDGAPILSEPEKFVDKLLAHARTLGIPA